MSAASVLEPLDGARPVDLLETDPDAVVAAVLPVFGADSESLV